MDYLRQQWAITNKKLILVMGIVFAIAAVVAVLSLTGIIDVAPVQTGVSPVVKK